MSREHKYLVQYGHVYISKVFMGHLGEKQGDHAMAYQNGIEEAKAHTQASLGSRHSQWFFISGPPSEKQGGHFPQSVAHTLWPPLVTLHSVVIIIATLRHTVALPPALARLTQHYPLFYHHPTRQYSRALGIGGPLAVYLSPLGPVPRQDPGAAPSPVRAVV